MKKRNFLPDPDGILLVDKPQEWTSHDLVAKVRNHFRLNKVGHGGTLDPNATGLVVLLIGRGTRLSAKVMGGDKIYEGEILLGVETDSQDTDGKTVAEKDPSGVSAEQLVAEMKKFIGDQMQMPPMVSAIKKDGVPLYKLARKGQEVEREPRFIHVYSFALRDFVPPRLTFEVMCTKGTYVRTIAHDLGQRLGCGACLSQLRRTQAGGFSLSGACTIEDLLQWDRAELEKKIVPIHQM